MALGSSSWTARLTASERRPVISDKIKSMPERHEAIFHERLEQGRVQKDLPQNADTLGLARFFNSLMIGMSVLARVQQSSEVLLNIAQLAGAVLPEQPCVSQNQFPKS